MSTKPNLGQRPKLACEIGTDRVIAARIGNSGGIELHTVRRLPAHALSPGFASPNIVEREALRQAISDSLSALGGGGRSRDVIAVLPDAAVRVLLVDFDSLPDRAEEAAAIIRFRVKKSLPFDVDHAALSFHANRSNGNVKVVAALSPAAVIEEYEQAFEDAGYFPGVVMPSILGTLGLVETQTPTMIVKVDPATTSVAIVDRNQLVLLRTLDNPGLLEVTAQDLVDKIHPSMVFFEDSYSSRIESVLVTGLANVSGLAAGIQSETGVVAKELAAVAGSFGESLGDSTSKSSLTGVAGALSS